MKKRVLWLSCSIFVLSVCVGGCELFEDDRGDDEPVQKPDDWIVVEGGRFDMGDVRLASADPVHEVEVPTFEMKRTEVTVAEYTACVNADICTEPDVSAGSNCNWGIPGYENHPVNCVVWRQAWTFCNWYGGRLPSESEWEYAASSEGTPTVYPWGMDAPSCRYAIITDETGVEGCGKRRTWPVCSTPNGNTGQGLCDMGGNVVEWVQDHYHVDYTGLPPSNGAAWEELGSTYRVLRGAAYNTDRHEYLNVASRGNSSENITQDTIGIRCAR
jgi:iron(II)-dependent oxidoreductase